jgi:hypothetical protein
VPTSGFGDRNAREVLGIEIAAFDPGGRHRSKGLFDISFPRDLCKLAVHHRKPITFAAVFSSCPCHGCAVLTIADRTRPNRAQHYNLVNDFEPILLFTLDQSAADDLKQALPKTDLSGLFAG